VLSIPSEQLVRLSGDLDYHVTRLVPLQIYGDRPVATDAADAFEGTGIDIFPNGTETSVTTISEGRCNDSRDDMSSSYTPVDV
jgi:hypothetical protein